MSKIAELLKLAEKKKEDKPRLEIVPQPAVNAVDQNLSMGKQEYDGVSKSNQPQNPKLKSNQEDVSVSKGKDVEVEVKVSKIEQEKTATIYERSDRKNKAENKTEQEGNHITKVETSPTRDFTKVSNSIMRRAIPERYFRGLSKHTYDVLYQRTRGAIRPTRTIQLTKDELVRLTGLSKDAIKLHIRYLKETGLLDSRPAIGNHAGWEYEIFVPEEIEDEETYERVRQGKARQGKVEQDKASEDLPLHTGQNPITLTPTNVLENKEVTENPKTFFKTNTNNKTDDEAFTGFIKKIQSAAEEITGKKLSKRDGENLEKIADLIVLELKIAARRTDSISSVSAFLAEVLRRRLRDALSPSKTSKVRADTIGKPDSGSYEIKPLDEKGREAALLQLQEFAGDDFLEDFKKWYTEDDWKWLTENLK